MFNNGHNVKNMHVFVVRWKYFLPKYYYVRFIDAKSIKKIIRFNIWGIFLLKFASKMISLQSSCMGTCFYLWHHQSLKRESLMYCQNTEFFNLCLKANTSIITGLIQTKQKLAQKCKSELVWHLRIFFNCEISFKNWKLKF